MRVQVQLFASARDRAGTDIAELELPEECTVAAARTALLENYPDLKPIAEHLLFAIDDAYAANDSMIPLNSRLACFPPVSGG